VDADTHYPCIRPVCTGREYGPYVRVVRFGRVHRPHVTRQMKAFRGGSMDALEHQCRQFKIKLVPYGADGRLLLSGFQSLVPLTLTLDRVTRHTVVHRSSTSIYVPNFIEIGKKLLSGRPNGRVLFKFKVT